MRIDGINLIGNFTLRGMTGGSSQGIGYSGSNIEWISVTGSGGGGSVGPQGKSGPNFDHTIYTNVAGRVAFGDNNYGITFSNDFCYSHNTNTCFANLSIGISASSNRTSTASLILMTVTSSVLSSVNSSIIASCRSLINVSDRSAIISSDASCIVFSPNSVIVAGSSASIGSSPRSVVLGGVFNSIQTT